MSITSFRFKNKVAGGTIGTWDYVTYYVLRLIVMVGGLGVLTNKFALFDVSYWNYNLQTPNNKKTTKKLKKKQKEINQYKKRK